MDEFYLFILFERLENTISHEDEYRQYITDVIDLLDRADCEKGVELYYQNTNKQGFIDDLNDNAEMEDFYMINPEMVLHHALRYATNWERESKYETHNACVYKYWNGGTTEEALPLLKEIAEYSLQKEGKPLFLNLKSAFNTLGRKYIAVLKDCYQNLEYEPQLILIAHVSNFLQLEFWFQENRRQRNFNRDDNRHVKGHPDYRGDLEKSPLLCSKDEAQELLNTAITDQRAREQVNKDHKE